MANENVNNPKVKGFEIPYFYGSDDKISAKAWTTFIDNVQQISTWTDAVTAQYAYLALRDKAADWAYNQKQGRNERMNSWITLKQDFETRFHRDATLSEESALQDSLIQKKNESVNDFYDRVESAQYVFDQNWAPLAAGANAAAIAQDNASKKASHDYGLRREFLRGLREDIKKVVVLKDNVSTPENLLKKSVEIEKALNLGEKANPDLKVAEVAEIDGAACLAPAPPAAQKETFDVKELKECVEFIRTQRQQNRGNGRGFRFRGQRGQFRGYGSRRGNNGFRFNNNNRGGGGGGAARAPYEPYMKCHKCGQFGHRERFCSQNGNGSVAEVHVQPGNNSVYEYEDMYRKNEYMA